MRLNTVRSFAVRLDILALGSSWTPCDLTEEGPDGEDLEKSISVYLKLLVRDSGHARKPFQPDPIVPAILTGRPEEHLYP